MSSRLKAGSHNMAEVYSGFFTGFAGLYLFMVLLQ
jgi:hypothetical protein